MLSFFPKFIDLPPSLRTRVYIEAGLVVHEELLLNPKGDEHDDEKPHRWQSLALMLTCRQVNDETAFLFYSTNSFVIRYRQAGDMATLHNFQPRILSALTCLTVLLNVSGSSHGPQHSTPTNCPSLSDKLLQADADFAQNLILEWETTADHISRHIRVHGLDFGLICDVADVETAHRVVAPLHKWPILASCHIRLGPKRGHDSAIQQVACNTGLKVEGRRAETGFAGFSCLPLELRLRILDYTDLVAPLSKVSWGLGKDDWTGGYHLDDNRGCLSSRKVPCSPPYDICHPNVHQACRDQCQLGSNHECPHYASHWGFGEGNKTRCWTCTHYACQFQNCWNVKKRAKYFRAFCFCQRYHASYTSTCQCWAPPTPLFLVSRAFCRDAHQVFFGKNHFIIKGSLHVLQDPQPASYPESIFLKEIVPASALQHLHSLTCNFEYHNLLPLAGPSQKYAEFNFPYSIRPSLDDNQSPANAERALVTYQEWRRTIYCITSQYQNNMGVSWSPLFLRLQIDATWIAILDTWSEYCSLGKMPPEKCDQAIDTLKAIAGFFWPPLMHSEVLPHVLFAQICSDGMRSCYYIRPGKLQEDHTIHEPPELAMERRRAGFKIERMVELEDGEYDRVEGIWVKCKY